MWPVVYGGVGQQVFLKLAYPVCRDTVFLPAILKTDAKQKQVGVYLPPFFKKKETFSL